MFQRSSLTALAVVAVGGALIAGCSSSSSSSSSAPASAPATTSAAAAATTSAPASTPASSAAANAVSAADCKIINPISTGVIGTLTPLQSESTSKATVALKAYVAKLTADEAKLTSPGGKAALSSFISAMQKAMTESPSAAAGDLETAITNLGSACNN